MSHAMRSFAGASLLSLALVAYGSSAVAAEGWSVSHGTADASGTTRSVETGGLFGNVAVEGELRNTGSGCYTLWIQWTADLTVGPPFKMGTQCGPGSVPVRFEKPGGLGTTWVKICRDTQHTDCSPIQYL
ncbi:hypothetical protein ABT373_08530 [Streptomyces sp. NPDC000070]|uniref:hypothetical protein n=1 Tax=Streptomyces sp. NPDC000070 TaxID=3154240 RepID=UPI00332EE531